MWISQPANEMKWNESGFRPPLCTYRLNWARRTSRGWWDDWDDTVLQTEDSKFEWRSKAEHATSRSRRLPTIRIFTRGWGRNIFCFFQTAVTGNRTQNSGVKGSGANHYPRAPAPQPADNTYSHKVYTMLSQRRRLGERLVFSGFTSTNTSQSWINVGPPNSTLTHHWTSIGSMSDAGFTVNSQWTADIIIIIIIIIIIKMVSSYICYTCYTWRTYNALCTSHIILSPLFTESVHSCTISTPFFGTYSTCSHVGARN